MTELPKEVLAEVDYTTLMKDVLTRLRDDVGDNLNARNLVNTALDYLFYLEDNRRTIL